MCSLSSSLLLLLTYYSECWKWSQRPQRKETWDWKQNVTGWIPKKAQWLSNNWSQKQYYVDCTKNMLLLFRHFTTEWPRSPRWRVCLHKSYNWHVSSALTYKPSFYESVSLYVQNRHLKPFFYHLFSVGKLDVIRCN